MFKPALGAGGDGVERFTMPEDDGDAPARPTKRARRSEEASAARPPPMNWCARREWPCGL